MKNDTTLPTSAQDKNFLEPSPQFKSNIARVIFSIVVFVLVYLSLVLLSFGLLGLCLFLGVAVITLHPSLITLLGGVGLMGLGVMIVLFMIKFIFSRTRNNDPGRIEISANEYPDLFAFVNQIADDAGTQHPKKIFLSADVNAAVFYDSSFFSMFLPIKKNLLIGLGLVNSVNMSEFKAVIAHEFGHFSQKSMKLGSYVYTTNKVIYNMLFENQGWEGSLNAFAKLHSVLYLFAKITYGIANFIKQILIKVYEWIQLMYRALSREMEYHADLVAVSLAGSEQMANSLRRIEFASAAYDFTTARLNKLAEENVRCSNIFELQRSAIIHLSKINKLILENDLPVISQDELEKRKMPSRVVVKDQWASHPTRQEREENIHRHPISAPYDRSSPWSLFKSPEALQIKMTDHLYMLGFPKKKDFKYKPADEILQAIESEHEAVAMPERFTGFYDGRFMGGIEMGDLLKDNGPGSDTYESIYTAEFKSDVGLLLSAIDDRNIMEDINSKSTVLKSFDFDGRKFKQKDAGDILVILKKDIDQLRNKVSGYDIRAFRYYLRKAGSEGSADKLRKMIEFHLIIQQHAYDFSEQVKAFNKIYTLLHSKSNWSDAGLLGVSEKVDVEKQKYVVLLDKTNGIAVPELPPHTAIPDLRKHILDEPVADVYLSSFDYNLFMNLFGQVAGSFGKVNDIWQQSYRNLLSTMDKLSNDNA